MENKVTIDGDRVDISFSLDKRECVLSVHRSEVYLRKNVVHDYEMFVRGGPEWVRIPHDTYLELKNKLSGKIV